MSPVGTDIKPPVKWTMYLRDDDLQCTSPPRNGVVAPSDSGKDLFSQLKISPDLRCSQQYGCTLGYLPLYSSSGTGRFAAFYDHPRRQSSSALAYRRRRGEQDIDPTSGPRLGSIWASPGVLQRSVGTTRTLIPDGRKLRTAHQRVCTFSSRGPGAAFEWTTVRRFAARES